MKTVVARDGIIQTMDYPKPILKPNFVLIETMYSAISPGTEMSMQRRTGMEPIQLGYSAAGIVREIGPDVTHIQVGQKVACYGAPFVKHAGWLAVPKHLVAEVPEHVDIREAAFAGLGAIAIHALRQANIQFGERAVVIGLGILGQIIAQIGHAASYQMIACDLLSERCEKLKDAGIPAVFTSLEELEAAIPEEGVDTVLLCAGGDSSGLIDQALTWLRDRGRIVIVGDIKMQFERELMFAKEAEIIISRAGGPGRYDHNYEISGFDYPPGYVRWTEGRNVGEYVRLLADRRVSVGPVISSVLPVERAYEAYQLLEKMPDKTIGVLLDYGVSKGEKKW